MCEEKYVNGLEDYLKAVESLKDRRVFVLFAGTTDEETGDSWCPNCKDAEPILEKNVPNAPSGSVFLYVEVGDRKTWKDPNNAFRLHDTLKITNIPTLIEIGTDKRLKPDECMDSDKVASFFSS